MRIPSWAYGGVEFGGTYASRMWNRHSAWGTYGSVVGIGLGIAGLGLWAAGTGGHGPWAQAMAPSLPLHQALGAGALGVAGLLGGAGLMGARYKHGFQEAGAGLTGAELFKAKAAYVGETAANSAVGRATRATGRLAVNLIAGTESVASPLATVAAGSLGLAGGLARQTFGVLHGAELFHRRYLMRGLSSFGKGGHPLGAIDSYFPFAKVENAGLARFAPNPAIARNYIVAKAIGAVPKVAMELLEPSAPAPTGFFDGRYYRRVNDMGADGYYAQSVMGGTNYMNPQMAAAMSAAIF